MRGDRKRGRRAGEVGDRGEEGRGQGPAKGPHWCVVSEFRLLKTSLSNYPFLPYPWRS